MKKNQMSDLDHSIVYYSTCENIYYVKTKRKKKEEART